jgi:hypothetical protein
VTLSGYVIARDEAAGIARAVTSLAAVADEVVVVDTGSTDATPVIAAAAGARVVRHPWDDDEGAARSRALAELTGEWVLTVDADEQLLPESVPAVRACVAGAAARGADAFLVVREDLADADDPTAFSEMWQLRLFRRHPPGLRYVGRCHARLDPPPGDGPPRVLPSDVRVRHWGLTAQVRQAKLRRKLTRLELELRDRPGQLYYLIEHGCTLLQLGDDRGHNVLRAAAPPVLAAAREAAAPPTPLAAMLLEYWLVTPPARSGCTLADAELADLCARWFPDAPPLLWRLAQRAYDRGDFAVAAGLLRHLVDLRRVGRYDRSVSFDPRILGDDATLNLGACYVRLANLPAARACFESLLGSRTAAARAARNLATVDALIARARAD